MSARRLAAALLATLVAAPASTAMATDVPSGRSVDVIVREHVPSTDRAEFAVVRAGGTVKRQLAIIGGFSASLPASAAPRIASHPSVSSVTPDSSLRLHSTYDPVSDTGSMYNSAGIIGAPNAWRNNVTGKGVDVAVIDSGIARVPGLDAPGKVVRGPDLSFDSQASDGAEDGFGHGTHMAGIIGARDDAKYTNGKARPAGYYGIAPEARLVSIKVADRNGATDVSQVIAAIDWVVQHRNAPGLNIRVLNLSFGTESLQGYEVDPLAFAAEVAWRRGIVVVASAGNNGTTTGRLSSPAYNPHVIAVGADDTRGTNGLSDDEIPTWSSRGDGVRNPDLVAPGRSIQGLRVPDSLIDNVFPDGRLGDRFFRGSGSSQAAAMVSGVAALMLSNRPSLTPDQVKDALVRSAMPLNAADPQGQGAGLVNADFAVRVNSTVGSQPWTQAAGNGTLEASRGGANLVDGETGIPLAGEADIFGKPFDSSRWASASLAGTTWSSGTWNGSTWAGTWDSVTCTSVRWSNSAWSGSTWDSVRWSGVRWSSVRWSGVRWSSVRWSSVRWA